MVYSKKYVECISNDKLRSELAAFRLSAHNLDIERGRHNNVPEPSLLNVNGGVRI